MVKKTFLILVALFAFLAFPKNVFANEGTVDLLPREGQSGRCFAASVFVDGSYKILMTCRDLKVAVDPESNKYVVWAEVTSSTRRRRLGEIINGKLQATTDERFDRLFVSLEKDAYVTRPVGNEVVGGTVEAIDFGSSNPKPTITVTPTVRPGEPVVTPTPSSGQPNRLVSVVTGIGRAILLGFVLLLIIVGVMSWLARRKSL